MMIAALMLLGTSAAFAADSEPLKAITKAKDYAEAMQLLKSNLDQLASNQEKAKAYNFVTKMALSKFDKENAVQASNMQAQLTKQKEEAYDTIGFYEAAYNATVNGLECMKYDAMPDEKGKVKPKFTSSLTPLISNARMQLVTAGNYYAQKNDQDGVLKYWGFFLDTDDNPVFASSKEQEKQFIGQVAYYSALYANQAKLADKAEKYIDIALQDPEMAKQAQSFKMAIAQQNLKTHADSVNYMNKLKEAYEKDKSNNDAFGLLCNMYSSLGMNAELDAAVAEKLTLDPENFAAWALKGQVLMNRNSTAEKPNWDECIDALKHAAKIDGTNPVVLTYLGFSLNAKASQIDRDREAQKALYSESQGFLEQAKNLDPNREKANWAYPLYQCYYSLYTANDARTQELEKMLK